ncbi:MAG: beta-ketoacyl-[acyl-carrier-protein] synthase II, partial [Nitrospira sp.]|nr:beta-ketoacyl-[acyl-carrier-protein] synthase II [Nitrospira sp.]
MKRVVVTGIGAVSPLGNSFYTSWEASKSGVSGIGPITKFDTSEIRWKVAGELKGFDATKYLSQKEIHRLDPFVHYAVAAAIMAAEDAGLIEQKSEVRSQKSNPPLPPFAKGGCGGITNPELRTPIPNLLTHAGIIIGSSRGGISTIEKELQKICLPRFTPNASRLSAYLMPATTTSMASSYVAQKLGINGYCLGISNACASGTNAIGEAFRLIKSGYQGPVFCGGTEAPLCRICAEGYGVTGVLSKVNDSSASKPFDRMRDGFVLSEGACILILEEYKYALERGAKMYGEIVGYGNTTDAFHQTIPDPNGEAHAIKMALKDASLKPDDIDYINAHGTSTPRGDKAETKAIKLSFGKMAYQIPVSSVKSMTGHMLAASGALEAAFTLMSMNEGIIPPTINLKEFDPECDLDFVTRTRKAEIEVAI